MKMYCEYGEVVSDGTVACYQPFPSSCDSGACNGGTVESSRTQADLLCCQNGDCYEWDIQDVEDCVGDFSWCSSGYLKEDGTVDCYD
ncbi:hypothetical protein [Enhygromyxa salina]|nr:hypothetical protein [Enhygromyxa salina]